MMQHTDERAREVGGIDATRVSTGYPTVLQSGYNWMNDLKNQYTMFGVEGKVAFFKEMI